MSSEVKGLILIPMSEDHCKDIQVYGIKRSGNHAIISWILGHFNSSIHYNNCIVDTKSTVFFRNRMLSPDVQIETPPLEAPPEDFRKLVSFEDRLNLNESRIEFLGKYLPKPKTRILILRDPYNTYASRIKMTDHHKEKLYIEAWLNPQIWIDAAKEFLGITNHLNATIKINYNQWFKYIEYRKFLSANFGVFLDTNFKKVPSFGYGSSFDGVSYDGKADEMMVLSRWKTMLNNETFKKILKNKELNIMAKKIFGNIITI